MLRDDGSDRRRTARFVQVSRLGEPLINEVVIPLGQKDCGTGSIPKTTSSSRACI